MRISDTFRRNVENIMKFLGKKLEGLGVVDMFVPFE
jgi:hypothetical protein